MDDPIAKIRTPKRGFSPVASLFSGRAIPAALARIGLRLSTFRGKPLKFGRTVIAVRHADVVAVLHRDLDFLIAPVNAQRIGEVNGGGFILGMDRSSALIKERGALYRALAALDLSALAADIRNRSRARLDQAGAEFDAIDHYARPVAVATAQALFGIAPDDQALFAEVVRAIFHHTFLNLGNDRAIRDRALVAAPLMQDWFTAEIARRRASGDLGQDLMGQLLGQGLLEDDSVRRTLGGMLVGSIDTTVSTFARIFCVLERDRGLAAQILTRWRSGEPIFGLCLEALRRWPHNPILLRQTAAETVLGGRIVPAGARVVAWTQAAMQDPDAFPDPRRMMPDRPVPAYLHFGAGLHPCAGRAINAIQIPVLLGLLLEVGGRRSGKLGWAGPFPDSLPVKRQFTSQEA
ncbi:MAG: cytochrome P450 [Tabrizicola sp.]|nr:cytochrome P450 [Tabrizicola sp.]